MATLEVHDAENRVRFVELDRNHPLLLGSSPSCDLVLAGDGIFPVHARIRWRGRRFKVDASPDAEYLEVNERKIVSSSLHQGDELKIGANRIFVIRLDDAPPVKPSRNPAKKRPKPSAAEEEATKVLSGPPHVKSSESSVVSLAPLKRASIFDDDAILEGLEAQPRPNDEASAAPLRGAGRGRFDGPKRPGLFARLRSQWRAAREAEAAPGRKVVASSPTVLILVGALAALVGLGFWLNSIIASTVATRTFNRAVGLMEDGDNATAIRDFDAFLSSNPGDRRVDKARTLRALANVRQYISVSGATWSRALEAAREMVESTGELPEFRDEKSELADLVLRIGEGLADRARRGIDAEALADAESTVPLHAKIAGESSSAFLTKSRLPELLSEARAAIRKADMRVSTLAEMDRSIAENSATRVYKARDALVRTYADLAKDPAVVERMVGANSLMRSAVKVDPSRRPADSQENPEPLGPATCLVFRSRSDASPGPPPLDGIAYVLADGSAYALDARTGTPLWQTAVGLASAFVPSPIPGDPSVFVHDARSRELARRDSRTGRLIWRQSVAETIDSPPLVLGERVYQTLPSGRLLVLALATGEVESAVDMKFPTTRTPVADESGRFLYVLGRRDCLFTISREPLACVDVQYLGHAEGSIPCPPVRLGRFLVVAENDQLRDGRWRVLMLDEDGARPRLVQSIELAGWTWGQPPTSGSSIWAIGDRGGLQVFAAGDYASASPLRTIAKLGPDAEASGPAFGFSATEREIWVASSRSGRYDLETDRGRLAGRFLLGDIGPAAGPIQMAARRILFSSRPPEGGVALRGVDPSSGKIEWESVVGAPWPTPLVAAADGGSVSSVDRTGGRLRISREELKRGGFISSPLPKPGDARVPNGVLRPILREGKDLTLIVPDVGQVEIWADAPDAIGGWTRTELPSPLAAPPLPWAGGLLVPGEDGRVYLVDPTTGKSDAEPLVPRFERDRTGRWLAPARLDDATVVLADDSGRIRRISVTAPPDRRIVSDAETSLDRRLVAPPACTASAVVIATADGDLRAVSARDFSPVGAWKLDAPLLDVPHPVDGRVVVYDSMGGVVFLERDGRRSWTTSIGAEAVGPPLLRGDLLWIVDRSGKARGLSAADGRQVASIELGIQPIGGLMAVGPDVFVPTGRGVVRSLELDRAAEAKP